MDGARQRREVRVALALAAAGLILFAVCSARPAAGELSYGFASYYTAARLVRDGAEPARFYENRWFLERSIDYGFVETPDVYFVNPPPMALLFLPLTVFSPERADVAWTLANLALLAASLAVIFAALRDAGLQLDWRGPLPWALLALALVFNPIWENMRFGQLYVLLLLFLSLALRAYLRGQDPGLGFWLGILLATKSAGLLLWVLPLLARRYRALAWGAGTVAGVALLTVPLLGVEVWREYVNRLPGLFNQPWSGVTAYQTTTSLIHHTLHIEPRSNGGASIVDWPGVVAPLATLTNAVIFGVAVLAGWVFARDVESGRLRLARFSLLSGLLVPLQPLGEEHHYTLMLPAVMASLLLALELDVGARRGLMLLLASLATLLIAAPLHHTHPSLAPGFRALLAYPKLYGGIALTGAMTIYLAAAPATWRATARQAAARLGHATGHASRLRRPASALRLLDRSPRS